MSRTPDMPHPARWVQDARNDAICRSAPAWRVPATATLTAKPRGPARLRSAPACRVRGDAPPAYRPGRAPNSSVDPNPSSAPDSAVPLARASAATAAATAGATSRLNTDGIT